MEVPILKVIAMARQVTTNPVFKIGPFRPIDKLQPSILRAHILLGTFSYIGRMSGYFIRRYYR